MAPRGRLEGTCSNSVDSRNAKLWVKRTVMSSRLLSRHDTPLVPRFQRNELVLGDLLGSGAFSHVYELCDLKLLEDETNENEKEVCPPTISDKIPSNEHKMRENLAMLVHNSHESQFAVKILQKDASYDAAADFWLEQEYLTALSVQHPHANIIKLYGSSTSNRLKGDDNGESFLILERVEETLHERMKTWKLDSNPQQEKNDECILLERLHAARQLSAALMHLHRLGILYRDVKPNNVGFTRDGTVKLLDFGLVQELTRRGMYCTGMAGSYRYMAPEVLQQRPYTLSADVYSFGMVLWQMLSLEPWMQDITSKRQYVKHIVVENQRPLIQDEWSDTLKQLLESCWARESNKRPTMKQVHCILEEEIERMTTFTSLSEDDTKREGAQ